MNDSMILQHINGLVQEEHDLHEEVDLSEVHRKRLSLVAEQLDQCWDLLRQRRARRAAGLAAEDAVTRDVRTAELYTR